MRRSSIRQSSDFPNTFKSPKTTSRENTLMDIPTEREEEITKRKYSERKHSIFKFQGQNKFENIVYERSNDGIAKDFMNIWSEIS